MTKNPLTLFVFTIHTRIYFVSYERLKEAQECESVSEWRITNRLRHKLAYDWRMCEYMERLARFTIARCHQVTIYMLTNTDRCGVFGRARVCVCVYGVAVYDGIVFYAYSDCLFATTEHQAHTLKQTMHHHSCCCLHTYRRARVLLLRTLIPNSGDDDDNDATEMVVSWSIRIECKRTDESGYTAWYNRAAHIATRAQISIH